MNHEVAALAGKKYEIVDRPVEATLSSRGKYHDLALALKNLSREKSIKLYPKDCIELGMKMDDIKPFRSFRTSLSQTCKKIGVKIGACIVDGCVRVYTR